MNNAYKHHWHCVDCISTSFLQAHCWKPLVPTAVNWGEEGDQNEVKEKPRSSFLNFFSKFNAAHRFKRVNTIIDHSVYQVISPSKPLVHFGGHDFLLWDGKIKVMEVHFFPGMRTNSGFAWMSYMCWNIVQSDMLTFAMPAGFQRERKKCQRDCHQHMTGMEKPFDMITSPGDPLYRVQRQRPVSELWGTPLCSNTRFFYIICQKQPYGEGFKPLPSWHHFLCGTDRIIWLFIAWAQTRDL